MRAFDWAASPLGDPAAWPQSLRSMISVCLNSPMLGAVLWGPDLRMFYNDAYIDSMADRHPAALGAPVACVWGDAWTQVSPPFLQCLQTGQGFSQTRVPLPIVRRGKAESTWWDFSAAPIRGEDGSIVGLFNQGVEITDRVVAEAEIRADADAKAFLLALEERLRDRFDADACIRAAAELLGRRLGVGQVAYGEFDASGEHVDVRSDWNDGHFEPIRGQFAVDAFGPAFIRELRAGRTVAIADIQSDPRSCGPEALPAFESVGVAALVNVPVFKDGRLMAVLAVLSNARRIWSPDELALAEQVAERLWASVVRMGTHTLLQHSERRLEAALAIARLGAFEWNFLTGETRFDQRARDIFGFSPDERLDAQKIIDRIEPADRPSVDAETSMASRVVGQRDIEYRVRAPGAPIRLVRSLSDVSAAADGRIERVIGVFEDVTQRRQAETRLRDSEEFNRRVLASSDDCIKVLDLDACIIFMSEGGQRVMEVSEFETIRGKPWPELWKAEGHHDAIAAVAAARDGMSFRFQGAADTLAGTPKWWDVQVTPILDAEGRPEKLLSVSRDITTRKQIELALQALNETLEHRVVERTRDRNSLWELSSDIMLRCEASGTITAVNPAWTEVLGWRDDELLGQDIFDFIHPDDRHRADPDTRASGEGRPYRRFDNRYLHKDGSYRWISWSTRLDQGVVNAVGRDVTLDYERAEALKVAEASLRQAQKMEAVGQLTGGLAHDFNNLLAGISGSLELTQVRLAQGRFNDVDRYMAAAQGAARRAAALTHRLLAFSRRQTLDPKPTDVNRLVFGMEELIRRTIGPSIELETVGAAGLWPALVDASQLENALLNLCINARDAMPDGGRITIETANKWLDRWTADHHTIPDGQYLSLCVTDTGTGMTPEVIARVFEPFFTTKPIGAGTGLGLSMIYGFAHQSGGQVRIYSEVGQGTTVCIYLPRHQGEGEVVEPLPTPAELPRAEQGETVLVVDDEPTVRMLVADILDELGYTAIEADDGPSGLRILQSDARIDLLISDVGLPGGMNGRQMADAARVSRPELKVLFITGYAENSVVGNGHLAHGMQVLTKPFAVDVMADRIRAIIGAD